MIFLYRTPKHFEGLSSELQKKKQEPLKDSEVVKSFCCEGWPVSQNFRLTPTSKKNEIALKKLNNSEELFFLNRSKSNMKCCEIIFYNHLKENLCDWKLL